MSDVRPNWARLTRRAGIAYVAGTGIGAFLAVQVLLAVRRRTRDNALNLFGPLATLRTIMTAILSKHVRNMFIASAVFTLVARRTFARWLPPPMRKGVVGNFVAFFSCAWYLFYRLKVIERPIPRYQRTVWNMAIMERFHVRPFQPVWWAFNAHVQTVLCNGLNCLDDQLQPFSKYDRELLPAFDGNSVVLDWASEGADLGPASPIVLVMHGIVGSAEENYCRNVVKLCLKRGWRPVVNFRWRIDFGENRDIEVAVDTLHARYPRAPIVAIAYSAGAHVLLTYLQRKKKATPLVGAVVVSAGFDLVKMMKYSELPSNKAYHLALSAALRQCITRHVEWDRNLDPEAVRKFVARMGNLAAHESYDEFLMMLPTFSGRVDLPPNNSIAEFGEEGAHTVASASAPAAAGATAAAASTAPRIQTQVTPLTKDEYSPFGNPTAAHYRFTAGNNMHRLAIPTLVLHAEDDPVCVPSFCPMLTQTASSNRNVIVLMTKRGGHSGWHQGSYPTGPSWAEYTAVDFLAGLLAAHAQTAFMLDIVRRSMTHELDTIRAQAHGANAGQPAARGIGSVSGAFTAHGTRAGATAASTGGAGPGSRSSRGSALERVAESGAGSDPDTAAQVGIAGAWYSGVRSGASDDGSGVDGSPLAVRLRTESEPYSPPVISRICSASDLTYPNLNLMTTPPAPVMWSPQRPVPGRRGDEADAGRQPVFTARGAGAPSSGARPPRSPGHTQFGVPLSPAEATRAGAAAAARGTRGDRRAPAAGGLMP